MGFAVSGGKFQLIDDQDSSVITSPYYGGGAMLIDTSAYYLAKNPANAALLKAAHPNAVVVPMAVGFKMLIQESGTDLTCERVYAVAGVKG
jgi:hypothetical protein